jgi:hypothetical protein
MSSLDDVISALSEGTRPDVQLLLSDWSDDRRILSGGAEPGRWRTDRTPYLREAADFVRDDRLADQQYGRRRPSSADGAWRAIIAS